jgi:hypothetical protein
MSLARRPVFPGLTGIAAAAGGVGALTRLGRYYNGPVSDHFDGLRFFDPHGSAPKSFADLLRWQLGKKPVAWPKLDPAPIAMCRRSASIISGTGASRISGMQACCCRWPD